MTQDGTVDRHNDGHQTSYTIIGSKEFVEDAIARIEANYHTLGYGTHFSAPKQQPDGSWTAHGSRANSCD